MSTIIGFESENSGDKDDGMDGGDWHQDVEDYSHKIATLTTSFITRSDSDEKTVRFTWSCGGG